MQISTTYSKKKSWLSFHRSCSTFCIIQETIQKLISIRVFLIFVFAILGIKSRALLILGKCFNSELHPQSIQHSLGYTLNHKCVCAIASHTKSGIQRTYLQMPYLKSEKTQWDQKTITCGSQLALIMTIHFIDFFLSFFRMRVNFRGKRTNYKFKDSLGYVARVRPAWNTY